MPGTVYQKTLKIFTSEFEEIYVVIQDLKRVYRIDCAKGGSLDNIGALLNFTRSVGETDAIYRERLQDIIFINSITGTKLAIQELLANYLRINVSRVKVLEDIPNRITIQLPIEYESMQNELHRVVMKSVAAGVTVSLEFSGVYWDQSKWDDLTAMWG